MLAFVDACYREDQVFAACVWARSWTDAEPLAERVLALPPAAPYEPGEFYKRELPCILAVLGTDAQAAEAIVIDGHVWLDDGHRPGLGAHLFGALGEKVPVIGVAKSAFQGATIGLEVFRGASRRPLIVTAAGMDPSVAASLVAGMHGSFRIPTLIKMADTLSRGEAERPLRP